MRCPDCNKFASFDTEVDPEGELTIDEEGTITGEVERPLNCADCSTLLKSATFSVDQDLNEIVDIKQNLDEILDIKPGETTYCTKAHDWDWVNAGTPSISPTERYEDKDRHGKKIKHTRFMKHMYGIEVTGEVSCKDCPAVGVYSFSDEEAASSFDEQV